MYRPRVRATLAALALLGAATVGCAADKGDEIATPVAPPSGDTATPALTPALTPADPPPTDTPSIGAETPRTITVDGVGVVDGPPDFMEAVVGIRVARSTVRDAVDTAAEEAAMMLDALRAQGLSDADVMTGEYAIYPEHMEYPIVSGYVVNYNVRIHVRDVPRGGEMIDAAVGAVGNDATVYGVSFGLDDDVARTAEARRLAVDDARERADQLAALVDGTITHVVSVDEVSVPDYGGYYGGEGDTPGAPFLPGEVRTTVTVTITFAVE